MFDLHIQRVQLLVDGVHDGQVHSGKHRLAPALNVERGVVVTVQVSCAFDVLKQVLRHWLFCVGVTQNMLYVPVVGAMTVVGVAAYKVLHRTRGAAAPRRGTILDPVTVEDALCLVERLSTPATTSDMLMTRLVKLYHTFGPQERVLRALSTQQQCLGGSGGREEYAISTVYAAMLVCIGEQALQIKARCA